MTKYIVDTHFYHIFDIRNCKDSLERYIIGTKIPRRYLRKPHYVITTPGSPTGIDSDTIGFTPYRYIDEKTFVERFELVTDTDLPGTNTYLYQLKRK